MALKVVSRTEWGARPPKAISRVVDDSPELFVHHATGAPPAQNLIAECAYTRSIQNFHMDVREWSDYSYGLGVAPSGRIFMGRGVNVYGAHCPGKNHILSVCLYGDYSTTDVPLIMREAVWKIADEFGKTKLVGHRQAYSTSCPGEQGMKDVVYLPRPFSPTSDYTPKPYGNTLRIALNGRGWAGWDACEGPLRWIAKYGLKPDAKVCLSWRGTPYRDPKTVALVAETLVNRFLS